jgi:hypothetical protein
MSAEYNLAIDQLMQENGAREGLYWKATITSEQVLARLNLFEDVNRSHHQYVKRIVDWHYKGSRCEAIGPRAEGGWIFHMRIRSK